MACRRWSGSLSEDRSALMTSSVLVAYATKRGSTQEVAEAIGESLAERGIEVDVRPAGEVRALAGYTGVVLGGALYMGRWHDDARAFLKPHRQALTALPTAIFAMGPRTLEPSEVAESRSQLDHALTKVPELEPVTTAIFGGVVDPAKLPFPLSHMPGSDARDWQAIEAWAGEVAVKIGARETAGAVS
jgi:menaquinone-dependent protoporphyrinogen oxidase